MVMEIKLLQLVQQVQRKLRSMLAAETPSISKVPIKPMLKVSMAAGAFRLCDGEAEVPEALQKFLRTAPTNPQTSG